MKIPVLGMDPSLSNWGLASAELNLSSGILDTPQLVTICPDKIPGGKLIRVNSSDLHRAEQLAVAATNAARKAKVIFVEVPVGSQSARAMASYGICVGVLGAIRALGIPLIEVTAMEVKLALSGIKLATKEQMISAAVALYPNANWPQHAGKISASKAEHVADAIGAIHAGVNTSSFKNLMRLYNGV